MRINDCEILYGESIKILKGVQSASGGCMATPAGKRYPYIYPRDNAMCVLGFVSASMFNEARTALKFIFSSQKKSGELPQRVDTKGKDCSYKPVQIDGIALTLYALGKYVKVSGDRKFGNGLERNVKRAVRYIQSNISEDYGLVFALNSIHEFPPLEEGFEIWANATSYAALQEAARLAREKDLKREWRKTANRIKRGISRHMWNSRLNSYVKNIRTGASSSVETDIDSSVLGLCEFGVFDDNEARVKATIKRIEKELWNKELGGICRYMKHKGRNNGGWGPWPHFTLMLCRHFIRRGIRKKAESLIEWVMKISYKNMIPEHISTKKEFEEYVQDFADAGILRKDRKLMIKNARKHPMFRKKGIAYITIPLAWPHAEFIVTWSMYKERFLKIKG